MGITLLLADYFSRHYLPLLLPACYGFRSLMPDADPFSDTLRQTELICHIFSDVDFNVPIHSTFIPHEAL